MSAYGDMLNAFPELLQEYDVFSMRPRHGAGYGPRKTEFHITGYLGRFNTNKEKIQGENRVENKGASFFCFDVISSSLLDQGLYVEDSKEIFQLINVDNYAREAGFTVYKCQLVSGNTDKQYSNDTVVGIVVNDY